MTFAKDLRATTKQYLDKIGVKDAKIKELNANKEKYTDDYLKQCIDTIQKEKAEIIEKAKFMINLVINDYKESIQDLDIFGRYKANR